MSMNPLEQTNPEIERLLIEGIRRMTPGEKLRRIVALNEMLDALTLAGLREQYPEADNVELRMRLASRKLPADLMKKAYGWDVELKGY
jgi:hypothetical protein